MMEDGDVVMATKVLQDAGYVVIPKHRVRRFTVSKVLSLQDLQTFTGAASFKHYLIQVMGTMLGRDLVHGPAAVWSERFDNHTGGEIRTAEVRVILPNAP